MTATTKAFHRQGLAPVVLGLLTVCAAMLVAIPIEPAQADRVVGTEDADRLVGTSGADRINGRGADDRINGRKGHDRLFGGGGADRIDASDGQNDRAIEGGPGKDTCSVDPADESKVKGCEKVKVKGGTTDGCLTPPPEDKAVAIARTPAAALARRGDPPPPTFTEAFFNATITIKGASDGAAEGQLPMSIEEVCNVPAELHTEALQLFGLDAVAIIGPATTVFQNGVQLEGEDAELALADLDAVEVMARLLQPDAWVQDDEGNPLPTFDAIQINIVD